MSGGIRTSVKGYTKVKRGDLAVDTTHENTERDIASKTTFINRHSSNAPKLAAAADCIDKKPANQDSPLNPPRDGLNSNVRISSVSVPSTPQIEGEILQPFKLKRLFDCVGVHSNSKVSSVPVTSTPRTEVQILQSSNLKSFAFNELKTATRNFRPASVVGEGGFGSVYEGWVDENSLTAARPGTGMVIAVKRLNQEGLQGHRECLTEINYLGQLHHENLVRLIGYCLEDHHRLLVYEFMPRGSLDNHLFRKAYFQPLSWNLRMKIAFGAAKGLAFLHSDEAKVIYRDFKTANILLDSTYNAKLSHFGLAAYGLYGDEGIDLDYDFDDTINERYPRLWLDAHEAPEVISRGHVSAESDVYSFGVLMLELLSGRRALDRTRPSGEHNLVQWAKSYLGSKRKVFQIFDGRIEGQYSLGEARRAFKLAIRCVAVDPVFRPTMDDVVKELEQLQEPSDTEGSGREKKGKGGKRNRKKKVEGSG